MKSLHTHFQIIALFFFVVLFIQGCGGEEEKVPQNPSKLSSDMVGIDTTDIPYEVELKREVVFESNEEIFIEGNIKHVSIDDLNRVFIAATRPGLVGIYAFDPDGSFITRFANEGRGPGEYESISSMEIHDDTLMIFDTRLQKMGFFLLTDFSHISDRTIDHSLIQQNGQLPINSKANKLLVTKSGDFLIRYRSLPAKSIDEAPKEVYFQMSREGIIQPNPVLQTKSFHYYYPDGQFNLPLTMPFTRSAILSISDEDKFYTSWTDEAQINIYDKDGKYESASQFSIKDVPVDIDDFELSPSDKRTLDKYELPKTWPKFHTFEFDDEGRLWVSMITDSDSTFKWMIVDMKEGNTLADFEHSGERTSNVIISKPIVVIKDEYFYEHVHDYDRGIDRIVKYKIEFTEL